MNILLLSILAFIGGVAFALIGIALLIFWGNDE